MSFETILHFVTVLMGFLGAVSVAITIAVLLRERRKPRTRMHVQVTEPNGEVLEFVVDHREWPDLERRFRDLHPQRVSRQAAGRLAH